MSYAAACGVNAELAARAATNTRWCAVCMSMYGARAQCSTEYACKGSALRLHNASCQMINRVHAAYYLEASTVRPWAQATWSQRPIGTAILTGTCNTVNYHVRVATPRFQACAAQQYEAATEWAPFFSGIRGFTCRDTSLSQLHFTRRTPWIST
jgi:hypothetical protein